MVKIFGVMDYEPFDSKTWSGSSKYFFEAFQDNGSLVKAVSAYPSPLRVKYYQLKSFHPDLEKWKFKFHINTDLFGHMSAVARERLDHELSQTDILLQVGAWYDMTSPTHGTISYHDGNLATLLNSPYGYPSVAKKYIQKALDYEKALYKKLDCIFPMSGWLGRSFVEDFGVAPEKVFPVGAGINLPEILNTEGREYDGCSLLMVGKDFKRKGGENLLKAFEKVKREIPNARLKLIGPEIPDPPDGVHCAGFIDKSDDNGVKELLKAYEEASVFVLPSLYEPFGVSFLEAMAHRLPCVGTNICAMPEIIQDGTTGYVITPGEVDELATKLIELLKSPSQCREMGAAGYLHYQKNYTWKKVAQRIVETIQSMR